MSLTRRMFFQGGAKSRRDRLTESMFGHHYSDGGGARGFPNYELQTHEGRTVRFYDDLVKGRIVTINFMYADCTGICPSMTANLLKVQQLLGVRAVRDVHMYSFTLRPRHDTPTILKQYVEMHGIGPGWTLLTGKPTEIDRLRRKLGFVDADPEEDRNLATHVGMVLVGNDAIDRWASCPAIARPSELVKLVGWMEPAGS